MKISPEGIKFIQSYEGCKLYPYLDQGGIATIGYGFTYYPDGTKVKITDKAITIEQADEMFALIVKPYADGIIEATTGSHVLLNQNQLDALTSFAYNCGLGAFRQSTLCQHVLLNRVTEEDFTLYDHVNGQVSVGLLKRRKAEYQVFIKPVTVITPVTPPIKSMTKFVKFYNSATKEVNTLFTSEQVFQKDGQTFDFATPEEMLSKSTTDTFNFWDNEAVGAGQVTE